jgi:arylamine N-acetyltransferase
VNTETGQIYDRNAMSTGDFERAAKKAETMGQSVVPVSEKVARNQRAGQIAMSRAQRRVKRRGQNNRKRG